MGVHVRYGDLLEFIGHMILTSHTSMERVRIHQRWLSHIERVVGGNEGLMADRAGKDGTRRSREAVPVVIAKEVAPRR